MTWLSRSWDAGPGCRRVRARAVLGAHPPARAPSGPTGPHVRDFLLENFEGRLIGAGPTGLDVVATLADRGVTGGAAYDGAIALAVKAAGRTLLTLDRRAQATYERLGVGWHALEDR
ncbi:MAG: hypothetical protein R3C32_01885 [Chloroflexota bacterium]